MTLRKKVFDCLREGGSLDSLDVAKKIGEDAARVQNALHGLKKRGVVKATGKIPYHYTLIFQTPEEIEGNSQYKESLIWKNLKEPSDTKVPEIKPDTIKGKIVLLITEHNNSPLNAREIAEKLEINLSNARYFLSRLKSKGLINPVGKQPWHYTIDEGPQQPTKPKPKKKEEPTVPADMIAEPSMGDFEEFLIIYTTDETVIPVVQSFKDSTSFSVEFEARQHNPTLVKIAGYKRLKCQKKVIFTPEIV